MEMIFFSSHYKTCYFLNFFDLLQDPTLFSFSHHQNHSPEQFQVIIILDLKTAIQTDSHRYVCQLTIACRAL